jgi:hypothetical protein
MLIFWISTHRIFVDFTLAKSDVEIAVHAPLFSPGVLYDPVLGSVFGCGPCYDFYLAIEYVFKHLDSLRLVKCRRRAIFAGLAAFLVLLAGVRPTGGDWNPFVYDVSQGGVVVSPRAPVRLLIAVN